MFDFNVAFDKRQIHKSWVRGADCYNNNIQAQNFNAGFVKPTQYNIFSYILFKVLIFVKFYKKCNQIIKGLKDKCLY